jgi:hypothetical protein
MNVQIRNLRGPGVLKDERLVLEVLRNDDIGYYLVLDSTFTPDGNVSNRVRDPYWFPDQRVKAGDLVVLYTKAGRQSEKVNKDGSTSYFFYRGLEKPVWNKKGDCSVLVHIENWSAQAPF